MEAGQKQAIKERVGSLEALLQAEAPHAVKFVWVKGHAGHPQNERCDELATYAATVRFWRIQVLPSCRRPD